MTDEPQDQDQLGTAEQRLAQQLADQRPLPVGGFRGALARHLAALDPGYGPRPPRLRLIVAGYLCVGLVLLALGALLGLATI
jgi:hypothetical protein